MTVDDLRYPIGQFTRPAAVSAEQRDTWIGEIERLPAALRKTVEPLTHEQLDTPYRPGGWTVRQVVHHIPDSHLNSYIRYKWALTEERPAIKAYDESRWAGLADSKVVPVEVSVRFLEALHQRWVGLLRALGAADWQREFVHPESGLWRLDTMLSLYAWHGQHHLAHITRLAEREGWKV